MAGASFTNKTSLSGSTPLYGFKKSRKGTVSSISPSYITDRADELRGSAAKTPQMSQAQSIRRLEMCASNFPSA